MDLTWRQRKSYVVIKVFCILCLFATVKSSTVEDNGNCDSDVGKDLKEFVNEVLSVDHYMILPGVVIEKTNTSDSSAVDDKICVTSRSSRTILSYIGKKLNEYTKTHVVAVDLPAAAKYFQGEEGKSSFAAGFGMGFLAFALKKLLLPVFIGAQLVKSVLIAMFLPSLLGGLGKLLGKGLSTFSGISGASAGINNNNNNNQIEDFEFKDTDPYANDDGMQDYSADQQDSLSLNMVSTTAATPVQANSRFGFGNHRVYASQHSDNYYMRKPNKKTDYKVFHKIPSSSLLLTSYDPFYSPLLSRLDAVFQQLGLGNNKSPETEKCRERLICMMYANPAKYAPYSNLMSAQLSRELNELRKPASDNPDILRFFRYMKAAKDGQDGEECLAHGGCPSLTSNQPSPAILTTFNEINKLVQARKLS